MLLSLLISDGMFVSLIDRDRRSNLSSTLLSLIQSFGDSSYNDLDLEKILVTVRHPVTREIVQLERNRNTPNLRPSQGCVLISQSIRAKGLAIPIGQVEIHAASSSLRAKDLLEVAQTLDELIQAVVAGNNAAAMAA